MDTHYCNYIGGKCDYGEEEYRRQSALACRVRKEKNATQKSSAEVLPEAPRAGVVPVLR